MAKAKWRVYKVARTKTGYPYFRPHKNFVSETKAKDYAGVGKGMAVFPVTPSRKKKGRK